MYIYIYSHELTTEIVIITTTRNNNNIINESGETRVDKLLRARAQSIYIQVRSQAKPLRPLHSTPLYLGDYAAK